MTTTIGVRDRLSPEVIRQAPRDVEILRNHARGKSYKDIAKQYGYANPSGPQKRVARLQRITALQLDPFYWSLEMYRLEDLYYALHFDAFGRGISTRRQLAASKLMLNIINLEAELTANFTVVPDLSQPTAGIDVDTVLQLADTEPTNLWTEALQLRAKGHRFQTIAAHLGLSGKGAAYKRVDADLNRYLLDAVHRHRARAVLDLNKLQVAIWAEATRPSPDHAATREVLEIIRRRCELLSLFPHAPD